MEKNLEKYIKPLGLLIIENLKSYDKEFFTTNKLTQHLINTNKDKLFNCKLFNEVCYELIEYDGVTRPFEYGVNSILKNMISKTLTYLKRQNLIDFKKGVLISTKEGVRLATPVEEANINLHEATSLEEMNIKKSQKKGMLLSIIRKKTLAKLRESEFKYITGYFNGCGDLKVSDIEIEKNNEEELLKEIKAHLIEKIKEKEVKLEGNPYIVRLYYMGLGREEPPITQEKITELWEKLIAGVIQGKEVVF